VVGVFYVIDSGLAKLLRIMMGLCRSSEIAGNT